MHEAPPIVSEIAPPPPSRLSQSTPRSPDDRRLVRAAHPTLVLEAPPGAGKTTRVPRALLDAGSRADGEIVVLEPRRLAARMAARRVADELGETPRAAPSGYQVRFEDVSSARHAHPLRDRGGARRGAPRVPDLGGRRASVVLDEFHERHLQGDVALALVERLRRDAPARTSRVVAMSATLDDGAARRATSARPSLRTEGAASTSPIEHLPRADDRPLALAGRLGACARLVARGARRRRARVSPRRGGDPPRARRRARSSPRKRPALVVPLHGDLAPRGAGRGRAPRARRKVILSTNVAESSITIEGVVAVVDGGLARVASQAPWSGLPRLRVEKVSRASAAQRAGRAGRTRPGRCLRLYTRADFDRAPSTTPRRSERLDLAQTWLELAALERTTTCRGSTPPPEAHVRAATRAARAAGRDRRPGGSPTPLGVRLLALRRAPEAARRRSSRASARGVGARRARGRGHHGRGRHPREPQARFGAERRAGQDTATERSDLVAALDLFREAEGSGFSTDALRARARPRGHARRRARGRAASSRATRARPPKSSTPPRPRTRCCSRCSPATPIASRSGSAAAPLALAGGGSAELARRASCATPSGWWPSTRTRAGAALSCASRARSSPEWLIDLFPDDVGEATEVVWDARPSASRRARMTYGGLVLARVGERRETRRTSPGCWRRRRSRRARGAFAPAGALDRWLARARFAA